MGFMDMFRGGSAREEAAKAMEAKKMDKMMQEQAVSDAYKAEMAGQGQAAEEKAYPRGEFRGEMSAEEVAGGGKADQLIEAYKRDPGMKATLEQDPAATAEFRKAVAERAGSGASDADVAEFANALFEEKFGLPMVAGTAVEGEGKEAA
ncbi:hypothetical protein A2856_00995 [Candidatus Uhrbacteria bacterium RIFCSPHIGHO2_01_FULL_63_20]|uniref:Uncharacterized protein n=1 Tax=Candidatus Uhrbacteria bacterium RIFCSPHIGHO2_01_FULL_63_20 TaxID=1802385 RepID=A0A1F7TM36_9BACT|nr:MAG: hypothetical protein A2856_00995 [Candidatus Uhrbacteria bacterium RIFCSPHIGHO2_01_FULL_63_20]